MAVLEKLKSLSDEKYKKFNQKIIPTNLKILGVRIPILRKIAKQILNQNADKFIQEDKKGIYELIMLEGMVLSKQKKPFLDRVSQYEKFLSKVDNWALTDTTVMNFKEEEEKVVLKVIKKWLQSNDEFVIRAGLVMLLSRFVKNDYLYLIFTISQEVKSEAYYVKMANAWLISVCMAKFPTKTKEFFTLNSLDTWTHNKAIQKSRESSRVSNKDKEFLKMLKK